MFELSSILAVLAVAALVALADEERPKTKTVTLVVLGLCVLGCFAWAPKRDNAKSAAVSPTASAPAPRSGQ